MRRESAEAPGPATATNPAVVAPQQVRRGPLPVATAAPLVHKFLTRADVGLGGGLERRQRLMEDAQAGDQSAEADLLPLIRQALEDLELEVVVPAAGGETDPAQAVFDHLFGVGVLGPLYRRPGVDEIRCNRFDRIYFQERGRNRQADGVAFASPDDLEVVMRRLILHEGKSISRTEPVVEAQRRDGSRVTAALPPFTQEATLVLRRHGTFPLTEETVVSSGMMCEQLLRLLSALVRGRVNILISGPTSSGKTSLLRFLVRYLHPRLRILTLETTFELNLWEMYPERDIVAVQEVPGRISMEQAFRYVLRQTPQVIIVGEARGAEAAEMIKAMVRGHDGTIGTAHFTNVSEAVRGLARMIALEGGKPVPLQLQELEVASALDIIVQMRGDPEGSGRRMVEQVTEVWVEGGEVRMRDLCVWRPRSPENWWNGGWEFPNPPGPKLTGKLARYGVVLDACVVV